jgi:hypothetical protein
MPITRPGSPMLGSLWWVTGQPAASTCAAGILAGPVSRVVVTATLHSMSTVYICLGTLPWTNMLKQLQQQQTGNARNQREANSPYHKTDATNILKPYR